MKASKKIGRPEYYINIDRFKLEHHVEEVFGYAYLNFPNEILNASAILRIVITYVRTRKTSSDAFKKLSHLLLEVKEFPDLKEPVSFDLGSVLTTRALSDSFAKAFEQIKKQSLWGRDLITIVLLSEDESLHEIAKEAGTELEQLQDEWYRYLTGRETKKHRDWNDWWTMVGKSIPKENESYNPKSRAAYLLIWDANNKSQNREIEKLVARIEDGKPAEGIWNCGSQRKCKMGETVYLEKRDDNFLGLTGLGEITEVFKDTGVAHDTKASTESLNSDQNSIRVHWINLQYEPVLTIEELNSISGKPDIWQKDISGLIIESEIASRIEVVWNEKLKGTFIPKSVETGSIATYISDTIRSGATDYLKVEDEAFAFARVAASIDVRPPLSIGVFGEWGSGKTFFMEKIREHIDKLQEVAKDAEETAFHSKIVQIRFNAWHYMETNLWASLVDHIFREMNNWLVNQEDGEKVEQKKIDELYERLATSRNLQLENLKKLIQANKRLKDAEEELNAAKEKLAYTIKTRDSISLSEYWTILREVTKKEFKESAAVESALDTLGISDLKDSAKDFQTAISSMQDQGKQGRLLLNSILQRFKRRSKITWLIVMAFLLPIAFTVLIGFIPEEAKIKINSGLLAISTMLAGISLWIKRGLKVGSAAISSLSSFNNKLNTAIKEIDNEILAKNEEANAVFHFNLVYEERLREVEQAETKHQDLLDVQKMARIELNEQKASTRLNRFIKNKITNGDYAKHLGIIAAIRKDFEELTAIMMDLTKDKNIEEEVENQRTEYKIRLNEIASELDSTKDADILNTIEEIRTSFESTEKDTEMQFFQRIVLYIDDLDRCPPKKVIEVLQACHLLLYFPLFVVVVAVDARWVSHALLEEYKGLLGKDNGDNDSNEKSASPRDYLEKIFQVPYWVRRIHDEASQGYTKELIGDVIDSEVVESDPRLDASTTTNAPKQQSTQATTSSSKVAGAQLLPTSKGLVSVPQKIIQSMTSQAKPNPKILNLNPNPKSLQITDYERDFLVLLSPYAGDSPRTLKRFVNVYKLLKAGLPDEILNDLVGVEGESLVYKAIIAQLAIVTGAPTMAVDYFNELVKLSKDETKLKGITTTKLLAKIKALEGFATSSEKESVEKPLKILIENSNTRAMVELMVEYSNLVKRYSFSARPFLY